jgi:DNA invertase Pin-like site-specific DNA recombinase
MSGLKIGCARVSTVGQKLTAQRDGLAALGVDAERVYVDHGLTGTSRVRPGLREALAACRAGDTQRALLLLKARTAHSLRPVAAPHRSSIPSPWFF